MSSQLFHNSLTTLPQKVVIDTNVLLDACFVNKEARQSIILLSNNSNFIPIVDASIVWEARRIIKRYKKELSLKFNADDFFMQFLKALKITTCFQAKVYECPSINKQDKHIAYLAREHGAWILTADVSFMDECDLENIQTRFPWDIKAEFLKIHQDGPELDNIFRVTPINDKEGIIYAQLLPMADTGTEKLSVFEIKGFGWLYHDLSKHEWVFSLITGDTLKLPSKIKRYELQKIALSYSTDPSRKNAGTKFTLACSTSDIGGVSQSFILPNFTSNKIAYCNTLDGQNSWIGTIQIFIIGPKYYELKKIKKFFKRKNGAPNPYDLDALRPALTELDAHYRANKLN